MVRVFIGLSAAALVLTAGAAQAQGPDQDVRCMIASNLFVKAEKDPARRQVAMLASYFYLGRVDARLSGAGLAGALKAQSAAITPASAGPVMTECAKRMQSAGMAMQTLGRQIGAK